jgi:hypothetical protein
VIEAVLARIAEVLAVIPAIFDSIAPSAVMPKIAAILTNVATIFAAVPVVLDPVAPVFRAIADVFETIAAGRLGG